MLELKILTILFSIVILFVRMVLFLLLLFVKSCWWILTIIPKKLWNAKRGKNQNDM